MSRYLKSIVFQTTFDGDAVTITLKPLEFADALKFRGLTGDAVAGVLREVMPKYVEGISGLVDAGGNPISKEEFLNASYFSHLVVNAGVELAKHAQPQNP